MQPVRITDAFEVRELPHAREGRVCVQLLKPLEYRVGSANSDEIITVPTGFITDFASIPRGLWNVFPPLGPWARAAIIHDYLYCSNGQSGKYSKKQADHIFKEAMKVLSVPAWQREIMYRAVVMFGARGWGKV